MAPPSRRQEALDYHAQGRPGKIQVTPTKPFKDQRDLSLAYTPGVAEPCLEIAKRPEDAYLYTAKGNLVAVVSNGTAVLGLGNIGALAGKPVMEGKGILFKAFADIDVFDLEVGSENPDDVIRFCQLLEPTVGGINLEDIRSPDCFYIEQRLRETLAIPVFHDDQHGTAIISGAALLNALLLVKKDIDKVKIVFAGAGAAAIATAEHYVRLGVVRKNIVMADHKGVIYKGRDGLDEFKQRFAVETKARTLAEALQGADVFVGLSVAGIVKGDMLQGMAKQPVIFALANPTPEIMPEEARKARPDAIVATGRSDFPNQVNNVLGFPFIFRGALDARAKQINEEMEMAATRALAALAKEEVPESVTRAYGIEKLKFGPDYLIPKPFDPRVLLWVAPAVAWAAVASGIAGRIIDVEEYRAELEARLGPERQVMRGLIARVQQDPPSIVFPEGDDPRILRAARILADEGIARPILLGDLDAIRRQADDASLTLEDIELMNPRSAPDREKLAQELWQLRRRRGITLREAKERVLNPIYYGLLLLRAGRTDALVAGEEIDYPDSIRPALEVIGVEPGRKHVSGIYMMIFRQQTFFFADTTVNIEPDAATLAEIATATARFVARLGIEPRIAMLSFSNFGSVKHPAATKVQQAVAMLHEREPELQVDGEMQADTAVVERILTRVYPFAKLRGPANVLIFPDLNAANIAYKLLARLGDAQAIGPILVGMDRPVHVLQRLSEVPDIVNMAVIAAVDALEHRRLARSTK
ncbi:MAG: NADP-dependent malic enzyme [Gemmatimonadetes bacterium]|nr:MAG: NADP-dependent malic enzyme [Gemmatimonadetes bacterium 13_1_40CM_3_66_12]OLD88296.1 MAG: NADP-dependent malic enzyme [Gemmatimonadetes bacterium 13_1_20CM_4_66_11]PYP95659.1 MAG: NADP-dependent malic enzyme [Gemmatimonadota bacterium]